MNALKDAEVIEHFISRETLIVTSTKGYSIYSQKELFGCIDEAIFQPLSVISGTPTNQTGIDLFKIKKLSTYAEYFNSICNDLDKICFTQDQVIDFIRRYKYLLVSGEGYSAFFLIKGFYDFMVVRILLCQDMSLAISADFLSSTEKWVANFIVIPNF